MPSSAIHLYTAYCTAFQQFSHLDVSKFVLGSIAPDCVNIDGFAPQEIRYAAHIRSKDVSVWKKNIEDFYFQNKGLYDESFLLGYIFHLYTDISWDEIIQPKLFDMLREKNVPEDQLNSKKWEALSEFDITFSKTDTFDKILNILENTELPEKLPCDKTLLDKYVKLTIEKIKLDRQKNIDYIPFHFNFVNKCKCRTIEYMQKLTAND